MSWHEETVTIWTCDVCEVNYRQEGEADGLPAGWLIDLDGLRHSCDKCRTGLAPAEWPGAEVVVVVDESRRLSPQGRGWELLADLRDAHDLAVQALAEEHEAGFNVAVRGAMDAAEELGCLVASW